VTAVVENSEVTVSVYLSYLLSATFLLTLFKFLKASVISVQVCRENTSDSNRFALFLCILHKVHTSDLLQSVSF